MTRPFLWVTLGRGTAAGTILCQGQSRRVSGGSRQVPVSELGSRRCQVQGAPAAPLRRLPRRPDPTWRTGWKSGNSVSRPRSAAPNVQNRVK